MDAATEKAERQDRILAELSELGLALARDLQARALAAEDVATASELGLAFQRVSRAVRQTLALEAKLDRDRQRDLRDDRDDAVQVRHDHAERRKAQVRMAVKRCVVDALDHFDADNRLRDLEDRLEEDGLYDLFADTDDIDVHIARLCDEMGVPHPGEDDVIRTAEPAAHPPPAIEADAGAQAEAPPERRSSA